MKKDTDEFIASLAKLEKMTLAERYQLKRDLQAYANSPQAKFHDWLTKVKRDGYYFLLNQDWLSHIFKRWYRLHRMNELAFNQFMKQEFNSPGFHRWNRFSNRLNRLSLGGNPWHEAG